MTTRVRLSDGRVVNVQTDDPEEAARAAHAFQQENPQAQQPQQAPAQRHQSAPAPGAPSPEVVSAAMRRSMVRANPLGAVAQPFANLIADPARREALGRSAGNAWRDLQQIPNLNWGQIGRDTLQSGREAVENLPATIGHIATHLPDIAAEVTYRPFNREEEAQQHLDIARASGDQAGMSQAAQQANAATAQAGVNVAGGVLGPLIRTPLQAAGFSSAATAPFALARNGDQPLQERLPQALVETGGAATFGAGLQYGANRLTDALTVPPRTGQMVERFDRAGVDPSLAAANGGGVSGIVTNSIADNLAAGPIVRGRMRQQLTQTRDEARRIGGEYGPARPIEEAGRMIERGVTRFARERDLPNPHPGVGDPRLVSTRDWSLASKADTVYDAVLRPILDNPAPLARTVEVLDQISRQADAPLVRAFQADSTLTAFERTVRRLQRGASDSFEPAAGDDVATMAADIENARRAASGAERSLSSWVRRQGGIRGDRGDVRGMDPRGVGRSSMLNTGGREMDDLAVNAWEDGFFDGPEPPTAREFMDALDRDIRQPGAVTPRGAGVAASNARDVLRWYEQQGVDLSARGARLEQQLRRLVGVDEGTAGRPPTLRDLRELRRKIRMAQEPRAGLGQSVDNASLQRLEAALTEDIYAAAGARAGDLRLVDKFYQRNRRRIDGVLSEFARGEPGRAIPEILALAKPNGNTRSLVALRGALRDDEWRTVVASVIEYMGQPLPGASGFVSELGFSVQRFATAYRAMTPQARRIIFGSRGGAARGPQARRVRDLADDLDNLAQVAQQLKGVEAMQNSSRSGSYVNNMAMSAGAVANLPATLTLIAGLGLMGEALTNPLAVRWLTSAPRVGASNSRGWRQWLAQLSDIAARDPALIPVYNELVQSQAQESAPSARESAGPPRLPQLHR